MRPEVRDYLDQVRRHLRLDPATERQVIGELSTHFEEEIAELKVRYRSEEKAARAAVESFGRARVVARLMYEAYSKGTWQDAALSSLPHLAIAVIFGTHLWNAPLVGLTVFLVVVAVTLFGWWHGKPNWLYSWIGYSLTPLLVAGYASRPFVYEAVYLIGPGEQPVIGIFRLTLLSITGLAFAWVVIGTTVRVVRRDWILVSLMLVPLPILGSWLYNIELAGGLFRLGLNAPHQWDTTMALAFAVLGATSAAFIRLRQRVLKIGAVVVVGTIALAMVAQNLRGGLSFAALLVLFILMPLFLFLPALLEARLGHGEQRDESWWAYLPGGAHTR